MKPHPRGCRTHQHEAQRSKPWPDGPIKNNINEVSLCCREHMQVFYVPGLAVVYRLVFILFRRCFRDFSGKQEKLDIVNINILTCVM